MVEIVNFTPFANLRFTSLDAQGKEFGVFMAKIAMDIQDDGTCSISEEQEPFVLTDEYHGELNTSSVRYPSDFVPYKPQTDIVLDATAYAPGGSASEWLAGIRVTDRIGVAADYVFRVTGPRSWIPKWSRNLGDDERAQWQKHMRHFKRWELMPSEPTAKLPIRFEYAYGGMVESGLDGDGLPILQAFEQNPIGRGLIDREHTDHTRPVAAPQIEARETPITDPYTNYSPEGFGPIPPAWLPRRPLGGTYDDNWLENVWPNWAPDYDFKYHNSAHPNLQCGRLLEGGLTIDLLNLHPEQPRRILKVPDERLVAFALQDDDSVQAIEMTRDTVFLEIGEVFAGDPRVYCVWRTPFDPLRTQRLTLVRYDPTRHAAADFVRLTPGGCACDPHLLDPDDNRQEEAA